MRYLGVDPGLRSTGWAILNPDGGVEFGAVRPPRKISGLARVEYILEKLPSFSIDSVCVERMVWRQATDPQDLIDLNLLAGAIGGRYLHAAVRWVTTHEWKGQLPDIVLLSRLTDERSQVLTHAQKIELSTMPGKLDAAAAIGIVRFAAGLPLT